jgi:hypothetical protein
MVMAVAMGGGIAAVAVIITDGVEVGDIITVGDTIATDFKLQEAAPVGGLTIYLRRAVPLFAGCISCPC